MAPKVVLTYFNVRARGELARLVMSAAGIDFEDRRVEGEQWKALKDSTPFGQLPILEWDGETIAQSWTIARFVAKKGGLAGDNDLEAARADMIVDHIQDLMQKVFPVMFAKTPEDKKEKGEEFFGKLFPAFLDTSEKLLAARGGKHYTGGKLSWADIAMMMTLDLILDENLFTDVAMQERRKDVPKQYKLLQALRDATHEQAGIKKWLATRPQNKF